MSRLALGAIAMAIILHLTLAEESLPSDCGRFLTFKYFLGNLSEFDDYPWLALLEYQTSRGKTFSCGGALVSNRYVLTAGHCVARLGSHWTLNGVRLGEYDIATSPDCLYEGNPENSVSCKPDPIDVKIEKIIVHEKYDTDGRGYDLALLKLADNVNFTEYIKPICLPKKEAQPQKFHVAGWGKLAGKRGTDVKHRSTLSLSDPDCKNWYKRERIILARDQFCAGDLDNEEPCIADSGGPLMGVEKVEDGSIRMAVFGILTMDSKYCGVKGWPGVYIDVITHRDWILQHVK